MNSMKRASAMVAAVCAALTVGAAAQPATAEHRAAAKQRWESMTPEQKAAVKEKAKTKWEAMTPEEQAAAKKRFSEKHPRATAKFADKQKSEAPTK